MTTHDISAGDVKAILGGDQEFALVDVREEGDFSKRHQLLAINMPLSRLELLCGRLLPCRKTLIILVDGGPDDPQGLAERARKRLLELGYENVRIMAGGMEEWVAAGYKAFAGVFVPSKAFGEFVEHAMNTPRLEPEAVQAMIDAKRPMVMLDTRPNGEYRRMNIPTNINTPGGELVYRVEDIAPDPETFIVVNCAGRTRSIIGCQSLRNAGVPNPMAALKGGCMGWALAGLPLERGTLDRYDTAPPSAKAKAVAKERAARVAERYNVRFVDPATLDQWRAEADERSLFLFDVRQPHEYQAGHMPGFLHVEGVTVVQSTDTCVGVRNGRIVLADDDEVRAIMAASWLVQMGYPRVFVLRGGIAGQLIFGTQDSAALGDPRGEALSPEALAKALRGAEPPLVLDLGNSRESRKGHVPGACWGVRSHLADARAAHPEAKAVTLVCDTGPVSLYACAEAEELWPEARVAYLKGGTKAWVAAGLPVEQGLEKTFSPEIDVYNRPYEGVRSKEEERRAMIEYLSWEEGLIEAVLEDGDLHFDIR